MSEKDSMINENGELLTEPYDNNVKMTEGEDAFSVFEGQKQIPIQYKLIAEEVSLGLLRFQKGTVYKKNLIYTIVLAIIFVIYVVKLFFNPKDGLGYFLCILSVAVIGFIWLLPWRHRKKMAKAISEMDDIFQLTVCEKGLIAGTDENASYIFFENEPVEVMAYPDMILFNICKEKIFILPRRCMEENIWFEVKEMLKAGLNQERYTEKEA